MQGQGWVVWVTGLPGSGKSVVVQALCRKLSERGIRAQVLSSDELRKYVTPNPAYSENEREALYGAVAFIASLLSRNNVNVVIDATGNLRRYREKCRSMVERFAEVYLKCPLEVCMRREATRVDTLHAPRAIYEKALKGEAPTVPGIGSPFEEPLEPEVVLESDRLGPEECAEIILNKLGSFLVR